jgi:hypothetical protein
MTTEPSKQSEDSSSSLDSRSVEWWVDTPLNALGLPAGSKTQQKKMALVRETPNTRTVNGIPIHSAPGEKRISYDQAMNWLWETGTNAL